MKYAGSGAPADDLPVKVPVRKIKPNLMSIAMKPYKYVEMTKAEAQVARLEGELKGAQRTQRDV